MNDYSDSELIELELARILIRETSDLHTIELREVQGGRQFPIVIGLNEAAAIERRLMGHIPPRPQTHELLAQVINMMGGALKHVIISDLKDGTFYAILRIVQGDHTHDVDLRPSDALALAATGQVPIFTTESVINEVAPQQAESSEDQVTQDDDLDPPSESE